MFLYLTQHCYQYMQTFLDWICNCYKSTLNALLFFQPFIQRLFLPYSLQCICNLLCCEYSEEFWIQYSVQLHLYFLVLYLVFNDRHEYVPQLTEAQLTQRKCGTQHSICFTAIFSYIITHQWHATFKQHTSPKKGVCRGRSVEQWKATAEKDLLKNTNQQLSNSLLNKVIFIFGQRSFVCEVTRWTCKEEGKGKKREEERTSQERTRRRGPLERRGRRHLQIMLVCMVSWTHRQKGN